jgi:competence protein ComEC
MTACVLRSLTRMAALVALLLVSAGCDGEPTAWTAQPLRPASAPSLREGTSPGSGSTGHSTVAVEGTSTAYFFDVGQGDATLLAGPDYTIVIDAGRHDRQDVVPHLREAGVESIDLLIGTHPHADHIGQFPRILEAFPVVEVWMSGEPHNSRTFERALDAILSSGAAYHEPRAGEAYRIGSARVDVLNPVQLSGNLHASSVSVRIAFGNVAFLFTGDAEVETERAMIERGHVLAAQILHLGHHGSRTSSAVEFLQAVGPEVAVYSAGSGNSYGHPHDEVVQRIARMGIGLYGTDQHGTIRVITDGSSYRVAAERGAVVATRPPAPTY